MAIVTETGALPTTTASDIITRAYRILGELGTGEALTATQASDGLEALNALLDSLSIDVGMIYQIRQDSLTWPTNTTSRTIGPSGDFAVHRPAKILEGTYFEDANSISYVPEIARNREVYDAIPDKTITSSYPELVFYDPSVSEATIYVYPVPDQALTLHLNSYQPLTVFDTLTETFLLPPGYRRMLAYSLAEELEAEVGLLMPPGARKIASDAKKLVKRNNNRSIYSSTDAFSALHGQGRSDIVAGQ
ncbi:MAG: hypothetical protein R3240_03740 [Gammaproteobacteria bacterium]|nr:hypothetical protein [Gammaproteobacteria bacterium]